MNTMNKRVFGRFILAANSKLVAVCLILLSAL